MAERRHGEKAPATTSTVSGADWYGQDVSGQTHEKVLFVDLDLTEVENTGAVFTECTFRGTTFNVSTHRDAAFVNCTFAGCTFYNTSFTECKFLGSRFDRCTYDVMKVEGGNWSFVGMGGADLRNASFRGVRMREADLAAVRCQGGSDQFLPIASRTGSSSSWVELSGSLVLPNCPLAAVTLYVEGPPAGVDILVDDPRTSARKLRAAVESAQGTITSEVIQTDSRGAGSAPRDAHRNLGALLRTLRGRDAEEPGADIAAIRDLYDGLLRERYDRPEPRLADLRNLWDAAAVRATATGLSGTVHLGWAAKSLGNQIQAYLETNWSPDVISQGFQVPAMGSSGMSLRNGRAAFQTLSPSGTTPSSPGGPAPTRWRSWRRPFTRP